MAVSVREDGPMVVAYLANPATMEEGELLAAVNRGAYASDVQIRDAFKVFVRTMSVRLVVGVIGDEDAASKIEFKEVK